MFMSDSIHSNIPSLSFPFSDLARSGLTWSGFRK